jgi:MATE family multidrug resistance protein
MPSRAPWKEELRGILRLALPVVLAELGWMLQGVVDTVMVGKLGPVAIGAVALGNALYYAPSLFGLGLLLGLDTVIAHAYGRRDFDACHRWLAQGVWIALAATPLMMLPIYFLSFAIPHMGVARELVAPSIAYLRMVLWSTLPLLLYAASRRYLQAVGQVRVIVWTFVGANLVNWGGNWVLIYGKLGFPAMGVAGSALATVFSRVLMAAALFFFAWRYEKERGHPLFAHWAGPRWREIRELLKLGLPAASQLILEVGAFGMAAVLAGEISPVALAAHQIALNYAATAYMIPLGISAAAAITVGHAIGAEDFARARRAGWMTLALATGFMSLVAVAFFVVPLPLIALYTRDPETVRVGVLLLKLAAAFAIFDGVQIVASGALRGLGLTRVPMLANLFGYWAWGLPLGVFLCFKAGWGVYGIWTGLTLALVVISAVLFWYWQTRVAGVLKISS